MKRAALLATGLAMGLAGCTVGPDFHPPEATAPAHFTRLHTATAPSKQQEAPIATPWWSLLNDPALDALEQRLTGANLDLRAASARLVQSRAQRRIAGARDLPSVGAAGSYNRERASPNGIMSLLGTGTVATNQQSADGTAAFGVSSLPGSDGSPPYDVWQAGVDVAWELDLWGGARRGVEAARAGMAEAQEDRRAILLRVQGELARDYIDYRAQATLLAITRDNLEIAHRLHRLTGSRQDLGVATPLDVAEAAAQVASVEAAIPTLEARRDALANAVRLLLGVMPDAAVPELAQDHAIPALPAQVPLGLPSELARRRPDIRRAEAALHRATAQIGVAQADFYPHIALTGSMGAQALALSNMGSWASHQYVLGPSISLPLFQGGRLRGTLDLRRAEQQEAAIRYQQVVLTAWHEIDDALSSYDAEQRRRDHLAEALRQNEIALTVAQKRYRQGATDFLNVLSAQRGLLAARTSLATSQSMAAGNLVTLCKALGGGWQDAFPDRVFTPSGHHMD